MKIACTADLHENLPEVPECDLLLIGGDICNGFREWEPKAQARYLNGPFKQWVNAQKVPIIGIGGNHDFCLEQHPEYLEPMNFKYICDEIVDVDGIQIYGSPYQITHGGWAFNRDEWELSGIWQDLPTCDIWLLHSPPEGYGDKGKSGHLGSPSLTQAILTKKPSLVIFGHIHEGYGVYHLGESLLLNASLVDQTRKQAHKIFVVELTPGGRPTIIEA